MQCDILRSLILSSAVQGSVYSDYVGLWCTPVSGTVVHPCFSTHFLFLPRPQIRPSDGGYGFTLEDRNRVPIIKSVEKGSYAEVG